MKRRSFLALVFALPVSAASVLAAHREARAATERYRTRGTVRHIANDRTRVRIRHDDIPGFMKAMTMPFDAHPALLSNVSVGDRVAFTFDARDDGSCVIVSLVHVAA